MSEFRITAAMMSPVAASIERRFGSIRRTSHIDMHAEGAMVHLDGSARDLVTDSSGSAIVADAAIRAEVGSKGTLDELTVAPSHDAAEELLGCRVGSGFRDAVRSSLPEQVAAGTPLALLLDDLPVATLISGYARLYSGDVSADAASAPMQSDICSGWREGGSMMTEVRAGRGVPVALGPAAPRIADERDVDDLAWHHIGPLPVGSMRRRRLLDVHVGDEQWAIGAMFRDTHVQPDGRESVLHEYSLTASVDPSTRTFVSCAAVPRVLPWVECPVAASSADRLVGRELDSARDFIRRELRGTSTCTHLNDLLRSLGDIGSLVAEFEMSR